MTEFIEGNPRIRFLDRMTVGKFDDHTNHYLSHCMKATSFIIGVPDEYIALIELKNPDYPSARETETERFI